MEDFKELIELLNKALEMEHQANIQYLSHAEVIDGETCEPIINRLNEIANDEKEHASKLRSLIGDFLDGVPTITMTKARNAKTIKEILKINLEDEKKAVDVYTKILKVISENKLNLPYNFWKLEHDVRHIIIDEQEHISELRRIASMRLKDVEKL